MNQQCSARLVSKGDPDPSKPLAPRASAPNVPNESNAAFKRDGSAMLSDTEQLPVRVLDRAMLGINEESTFGTPRLQLFFVIGAVQDLPVWILADSGSVSNLINETVYKRLPFQFPIRDPGEMRVIGNNGKPLDLKGYAVLPISLGSNLIWHELGVVPNNPFEVLIGADNLVLHLCSLHYLLHKVKRLQFGTLICHICNRYRSDPEVGTSTQLRFVDRTPGVGVTG